MLTHVKEYEFATWFPAIPYSLFMHIEIFFLFVELNALPFLFADQLKLSVVICHEISF